MDMSEGKFFYSVKTTGVYCRPSCGARAAKPENVAFHLTAADAERAGWASITCIVSAGSTRNRIACSA